MSSSQGDTGLPVNFHYEIDGVEVTTSVAWEDAAKVLEWSTSQVILYLGERGPQLQDALRALLKA